MINHNNRPIVCLQLPVVAAAVVIPAMIADKKLKILTAKFVQEDVISVDAVNFLSFQLKKNNTAIGTAVTTEAGLAVRTALPLVLGTDTEKILEAGDYLALDVAEDGTFTESSLGLLILDVEIIGN